jgi:uncharacterized membrane protein SpoIIM required for sporulation
MADVATFPEWQRLEELYAAITAEGFGKLEAAQLIEFGRLYRRAATELSFHRRHQADPARLTYLNDLLGRCYPYVYAAPRKPLPNIARFFAVDFPRAMRRHFLWVLLATAIALVPAAVGYVLTLHNREIAAQVLPRELVNDQEQVERHHKSVDWMPEEARPLISPYIMANNIKVSLLAFAGGMTAGVLTIILMVSNGLMLGVIGAVVQLDGGQTAFNFWAFVAPHGVLELPAIFISGAAGLLLAYALVHPGDVPRGVALREAGREAITLMLGVAAMLVVAGLLEGFFSPLPPAQMPGHLKYLVAAVIATLFSGYILVAGRGPDEGRSEGILARLLAKMPGH